MSNRHEYGPLWEPPRVVPGDPPQLLSGRTAQFWTLRMGVSFLLSIPGLPLFLACYREQLVSIGYLNRLSAREISVKNSKNATMYLMAFFSKHDRGCSFWDKITTRDEDGQQALQW